jgi:hypothetical protein
VRSLLSRTFCTLGLRERAGGAGRKASPDALKLLAYAREKYGGHSLKILRAAWRAGKAQTVEIHSPGKAAVTGLILTPQLQNPGSNCGTTISGFGLARKRAGGNQRQLGRRIFQKDSNKL